MDIKVIPRQEEALPLDINAVAIKHIEYYPSSDGSYDEAEITPQLIEKILKEIPEGIEIYLSLDPDGECDWMEVLSDGQWLSLCCCFYQDGTDACFFTYNADYADTADQIEKADFSDMRIWTALESGGQSPVPKIQAITDIDAGVKAVAYFIRTGKLYPVIDWAYCL